MERIQKIQRAKSYIEMLANEIDPTTQTVCHDEILKNERIKNCFKYISEILDEVIKNNGEVINISKPVEFNQNYISKDKIAISETPIALSTVARNINKQIDKLAMKKLSSTSIKHWLVSAGYLSEEKIQVIRNVSSLRVNENSKNIGIIETQSVNKKTGELKNDIKFSSQAQNFIIDNLEKIVEFGTNQEKSANPDDEILL